MQNVYENIYILTGHVCIIYWYNVTHVTSCKLPCNIMQMITDIPDRKKPLVVSVWNTVLIYPIKPRTSSNIPSQLWLWKKAYGSTLQFIDRHVKVEFEHLIPLWSCFVCLLYVPMYVLNSIFRGGWTSPFAKCIKF